MKKLNAFSIDSLTRLGPLLVCLAGLTSVRGSESAASLELGFASPPASVRPWVYWFWLNGNITSNGITADLEAMKRVGIGGVLIMEVDQGTPAGVAGFGTPPWRELFKHVCNEAGRLGLEVNMNNDAGWCGSGAPFITPDLAMQKLVWSETNVQGPQKFEGVLEQPKAVANYYRDIVVFAFPAPAADARIADIDGKAAFIPKQIPVAATFPLVPADQVISSASVRVISSCMMSNGLLSWEVPPGKWTVLRLGHTPTGKDNHPAPEAGRGLESDKLSKTATEVMFKGLMGKLIADSKPLAGKTLVSTHIDSWETGSQNWTPRFREEFVKRRGYDPLLFLPTVTGRVLDSAEVSERFLWDLRLTVSDLLVENYAGHFRRLAHQQGMRLSIEAYDGAPCDEMTYAGQADEPMAEFWSWGYNTAYSCLEMSSAAHVYGKRILGAEAFTANDQEKWLHHPATIKTLGDWAFCEGINRFVFHRYALQPWTNREPGMSMGPWGLHYERTQTWWEQSAAWHEYLARCQYLLRQGLFEADICFMEPEGSPMRFTPTMAWRTGNTPERPRYNFDGCTPEVVMTRMRVKGGRLVLPDGMSYRLLVLPQVETMSPRLLRRIVELIKAGATVIGPPPRRSPGLSDYPKCDEEVQQLARGVWRGAGELRAGSRQPPTPGAQSSNSQRAAVWNETFMTPVALPSTNSPLSGAKWIWHKEGNPVISAPVGERFFRRVFEIGGERKVASAEMVLTVDNSFELWVNGQLIGSGGDFKQSQRFNIKSLLKAGANLVCVKAVNGGESPNPAGLIGVLAVRFEDGSSMQLSTDSTWESAQKPPADWVSAAGSSNSWGAVLELGPLGMQPWGELDKSSQPPYVFPNFTAISDMLRNLGIPPDFEGDSNLRFIHRRDKGIDIYFVANSHTNWLRANCGFRVTGKTPEIWDPQTGKINKAVAWREEKGRTLVPLSFEPAGSTFVLFRQPARVDKSAAVVALTKEGQDVLPQAGQALPDSPPAELTGKGEHALTLLAWQAGVYELKTADGWNHSVEVAPLPAPLELQGSWEVRFQPNLGAPARVVFEGLVDWAQHEDNGVRYFSGTATYFKAFTVPPGSLAVGERRYLDLGRVAVMAEVELNGKKLGTLWKPPYRIEVTGALRGGENQILVRVVNLWVNRMIGDEQLPEDSERNENGTLKRWPSWLSSGQPSPTGRFTFTSWRLWKKDAPLQPSGLLGPVSITTAREVPLRF